uniref:B30.2/SPRY domain-containing protein n=1 Tax=Kryptolebias marmoratus TaxID=37003 RepID=A0A3Q3AX63_KRYMA
MDGWSYKTVKSHPPAAHPNCQFSKTDVKERVEHMLDHVKVQAEHTEGRITETFQKLHWFLQEEEKARVSALRREEKIKSKRMRRNMEDLRGAIGALSNTIRATEQEVRGNNVSFLRNYRTAETRIQESLRLDDPQEFFGDLIDVPKHLGNLSSLTWTKMKETISSTPVILDPNTAHPHLVLSEDLTSVRYGKRQKVPKNPERVDYYRCVLGSEGFRSGSHLWDVDVGDNSHWGLGMAAWLDYRKKDIRSGLWMIKLERDGYSAMSPSDKTRLPQVRRRLRKVRVHLRCGRGTLSFFDLESGAHIHTFTFIFKNTLYPYFSNGNRSPLRVLPASSSTKIPPLILMVLLLTMAVLLSALIMI